MGSTEDDEAFDAIVEHQKLQLTSLKAMLWHMVRPLLSILLGSVAALVRLGLAVCGVLVLFATHHEAVASCLMMAYTFYWGWSLGSTASGLRKINWREVMRATREERDASQRKLDQLVNAPTRKQRFVRWVRLLSPLGLSALAGIAVAYEYGPIAGWVAGAVLFGVAVFMASAAGDMLRRSNRSIGLMASNDPRVTPEI
jgi:hypothetical protein